MDIKYFNTKLAYGFGYTNALELNLDKNPEIKYVNGEFIISGINSLQEPNGVLIALNGIIFDVGSLKGLPALEIKNTAVPTGVETSSVALTLLMEGFPFELNQINSKF